MNLLLRLILSSRLYRAVDNRYQTYMNNGSSRFTAALTCLLSAVCWLLFRLESPAWQSILQNRRYWFPHINSDRPRIADSLRYLLQVIWLFTLYPLLYRRYKSYKISARFKRWRDRYIALLNPLEKKFNAFENSSKGQAKNTLNSRSQRILLWGTGLLSLLIVLICISQPFDLKAQFIFVLLLWVMAMIIRNIPGRFSSLMMIVLSLTISCRYIWWRYTSTLNWNDPLSLTCGLILVAAETYAWLVLILGYLQTIWPLHREPMPMPEDVDSWPTVDVLIPTYDEDLSVVRPTLYAALGIDWPKEKLNIYLLDDGNRSEFKAFADQIGVNYVARPTHEYAKAGNINYTLTHFAKSEYVAIFDCDHIPTRAFLQLSMGWFLKEKNLALVQTPHHFFSPDPFERNLGRFRKTPNEGTLFYGLVQDGNDMWNAAFFCGSCAIMRRSALDEVGGVAIETVTEDAFTSLKLHRQGYSSAYIRIPQAAGLATESLSAHIGQRIRWARGMTQILRLDNPLFGKGLKLGQRLCYFNAMLHFLSGIPRIVFLTAPLAYLLLHAYIIHAPGIAIILYIVPNIVFASLTNSKIQGRYRHLFWSEIYESVQAWYIARPTMVALFNPHIGQFNVTAKGGLIGNSYFDWVISRPYLALVVFNVLGLFFGVYRLFYGPTNEIVTVIITMTWVVYNLLILGGAIAVSVEARQIRKSHRVEMAMPAAIANSQGSLYSCTLRDYADGGIGIDALPDNLFQPGDKATLLLKRGQQEFFFPIRIVRCFGHEAGALLSLSTIQQQIDFIQCTFARADAWALWQDTIEQDKPIRSLKDILLLGLRGYQRLGNYMPNAVKLIFKPITLAISGLVSIMPREAGASFTLAGDKPIMAQH